MSYHIHYKNENSSKCYEAGYDDFHACYEDSTQAPFGTQAGGKSKFELLPSAFLSCDGSCVLIIVGA
jgi:hypothetical protein